LLLENAGDGRVEPFVCDADHAAGFFVPQEQLG
jgi:hypothetical protein